MVYNVLSMIVKDAESNLRLLNVLLLGAFLLGPLSPCLSQIAYLL
jgi:hypothetical protein